jgi:hypothetical protein
MANENTVSIEYTADGSVAIATANSVADGQAAAVDRMTKGTQDAATAQGMTWKQFTAERMGEYMRVEGGHAAAMKRMSEEWQAYKASGVLAAAQVEAAVRTYYDRVSNESRVMSDAMAASMKKAADEEEKALEKLTREKQAYKSAGVTASNDVAAATSKESTILDTIAAKVRTLAVEAAGAFAAFKLVQGAKDATMFAANVEQANRALSVIANNMGRTSAEAMKARDSVRDLGISTNSATNATAQFLRAGLPLEQLNTLARAAQGAAISYKMMTGETISSSEALDKMIRSIVTGNVTELHTLGINVLMRDQLRENKIATGEAAGMVDSHQRHMLLLNAALEQSGPLLNLYTNSMDLASKQISSSKRPVEELKLALGELFLPELNVAATTFYQVVSGGMVLVRNHTTELAAARAIIKDFAEGLLYGVGVLTAYYTAVTVATVATGGLAAGSGLFAGVLTTLTTNLSLTGAEAIVTSTKIGMMGETIATTSTVATIGLNSIKAALGVLSAFMVGWEFGKMLNARFESVRDVGTEVVWGLIRGWNELGFAAQKAFAHMDPTTSHEQTKQIIADIELQRDAWLETWRATKAEQLKDNAKGPEMPALSAPYVDNQAAIQAGLAAEAERLKKEQALRDQAAAQAAEKERKRQGEIALILAEAREQDLQIGKDKDQKELLQLDLKQQKELKAMRDHHASEAQIAELTDLQARARRDLVAQQTLEKKKAQAAAAAEVARKSFEEQAAWQKKLDDFQLKTGKISEPQALSNTYERERQLLVLKQQEIDAQIALESHEKKRNELAGQRLVLQNQIDHSYAEEAQQVFLGIMREEQLAFAHQERMKEISASGLVARLHFLGQEQGALTAHYAWKREQLNQQYVFDMQRQDLSQAQKLAKQREYEEQSLQLERERAQKQAELWWNNAQTYMQYAQQMSSFAFQLLLGDERNRGDIEKRMLATSIRFLAQYLQQFMFNKAKEHLLAAAAAVGRTTVDMTATTANLAMLETQTAAWATYATAMTTLPYGLGIAWIPAAASLTSATAAVATAIAGITAAGATSLTGELGLAAAWGAGGVLVGALGDATATNIEGSSSSTGTSTSATTTAAADNYTAASSASTSPAAQPQGPSSMTIIFQGGTFIGGNKEQIARDITPGVLKAINDGVH